VSLLTHMKHIIPISTETLVVINNAKALNLALHDQDEKIKNIEATLLLPSGRARSGGRKELQEANAVRQHLCNQWHEAFRIACDHMRDVTTAFVKERCIKLLDDGSDTSTSDVSDILKAASLAIQNRDTGRHTITIGNFVGDHSFKYDLFCTYTDHNGLCINITKVGEGRFIGGGIVNVRRKYQPFRLEDERMKDVQSYLNDSGTNLVVDVPMSYSDSNYVVAINNQDEHTADEAMATARLTAALGHICRMLNGTQLECFVYAGHVSNLIK
jgi:hypothetical protein